MADQKIYIIVAVDNSYGIGKDGQLPWHFPSEMRHFKEITTHTKDPGKHNAVIMGRVTWDSLPEKFRPLPHRENIVISTQSISLNGASVCNSLVSAIHLATARPAIESIFIIGGASLYRQALDQLSLAGIYLTHIHSSHDCDAFFPDPSQKYPAKKLLKSTEENGIKIDYLLLTPGQSSE